MSSFLEAIRVSQVTRTASPNEIGEWLDSHASETPMTVLQQPVDSLPEWRCFDSEGFISHESGRFFSIAGLQFPNSEFESACYPAQPIIVQEDKGILGFLVTIIDGCLMFLGQAKMEPGNWPPAQLSPTVQATTSNFERVHGGSKTLYLDYFLEQKSPGTAQRTLMSQLQIEQTDRFFGKANWNMLVEVDESAQPELDSWFRWFSLRDLVELAETTSLLHVDARSVLGSWLSQDRRFAVDQVSSSQHELHAWLDAAADSGPGTLVPISHMSEWQIVDGVLKTTNGPMEVLGVQVHAPSRERTHWSQPLVRNVNQGISLLVASRSGSETQFLVSRQRGPLSTGSAIVGPTFSWEIPPSPDAQDVVQRTMNGIFPEEEYEVVTDSVQSEEGGRFFRSSTRNIIVWISDFDPTQQMTWPLDEGSMRWVSVEDLRYLSRIGRRLSIELRSHLSQCLVWL